VFVYAGLNTRGIAPVWRKIMKQLSLAIIVAIGLTIPAFGQQAVNPEEGIYVLNPAESSFRGPVAKSQILNIGKETITAVGFDAYGKPYTVTFPNPGTTADGQSRPVPGGGTFDAVTTTQIDPYTVKGVRTKDRKVVAILTRIYNPGTETVITTAIEPAGAYSHVLKQ
jgi:hypothetical protein